MSAKKKKDLNAMEEDQRESDADSSSDEDNPEVYTGNEQVMVDFEGRAPIDPDCHGISQLLSRLFLKAHINCMEMAEKIIAQNYVGSVIFQSEGDCTDSDQDDEMVEDGTIFGITTVLNMTAKKDITCIEQLRSYILERAEKHATHSVLNLFRDALNNEARPLGFLINERFINIPAQISVPLFETLQTDIQDAKLKGMKFDFVYYLMIVKFFRLEPYMGKRGVDTFTNAEEEVICSQAVNSFEFSVRDECDTGLAGDWQDGDPALTPYRKIVLFDTKQMPNLIKEVQKFIHGE